MQVWATIHMRIRTSGSTPFHLTCPAAATAVPSVAVATASNTWSQASTVLTVLWCVLLRGCDSHLCLAACVTVSFKCVFLCGCSCWGCCGPVSLHACVCSYTFVRVCALLLQYMCLPAHGLWSKRKAQKRQAAGVQFGAVSCWMLRNEKKADSCAGVSFHWAATSILQKAWLFLKCLQLICPWIAKLLKSNCCCCC